MRRGLPGLSGPTTDSPTSKEDNLAIIASPTNGFGYVPDDYGGTIATAAALPIVSGSVTLSGLIGQQRRPRRVQVHDPRRAGELHA